MKAFLKKLIIILLFLLLIKTSNAAREYSVGVSPSVVDLGEIDRGTKVVSFFITTVSDEPLLVYLEPLEAILDFFDIPEYKDRLYNYSEQMTSSWVEIPSNPVELKPSPISISGIKGWREVSFLLNVPPDAEPGYHIVRIRPKPYVVDSASGTVGVQIAALTPVTILFKLSGDAIRQVKILDITGEYDGKHIIVNVHFINTGTVTLSAKANKIEVYNSDGNLVATGSSGYELVKPGEKKVLTAMMPSNNFTYGEYRIYASVDFLTGSAEKNSTVAFYPSEIKLAPPEPFVIPLWVLILMVFVTITILWYVYEKD